MSIVSTEAVPELLDDLAASLTGELVRPGDPSYDAARRVWNGMIDLRPAAVARCASAADVRETVRLAQRSGLPLAVRGGGHNVAGFGTVDGGLVADLSPLNRVTVDPVTRRVRAGGGALLRDLDAATQAHGLAVPAGVVSETGIAGLTLSGGLGWLRRTWGLSSDNLVAAELVTAAGEIVHVDEESDPDLLWGLRGGGGNFGVVTELVFEAHPIGPEVFFAFVIYPLEQARHILGEHERIVLSDDRISTIAVLGHVPPADDFPADLHEAPMVAVLGMYAGTPDDGERALQPLRELTEPLADLSGPMPYVEAQQIYDADYPKGHRYYWKSANLPALPGGAVDVLVEQIRHAPSKHSTLDIWLNGGAIARIADDATAFSGRSGLYVLGLESNWEDASDDEANVAWGRDTLAAIEEHASGGAYLNFPGFLEEGQPLVRASHGANYARLAGLKHRLDPENLFSRNANIEPAL